MHLISLCAVDTIACNLPRLQVLVGMDLHGGSSRMRGLSVGIRDGISRGGFQLQQQRQRAPGNNFRRQRHLQ
jgi:hypothetical protein